MIKNENVVIPRNVIQIAETGIRAELAWLRSRIPQRRRDEIHSFYANQPRERIFSLMESISEGATSVPGRGESAPACVLVYAELVPEIPQVEVTRLVAQAAINEGRKLMDEAQRSSRMPRVGRHEVSDPHQYRKASDFFARGERLSQLNWIVQQDIDEERDWW